MRVSLHGPYRRSRLRWFHRLHRWVGYVFSGVN